MELIKRSLLAILPLLAFALRWPGSLLYGMAGFGALLSAVLIFLALHPLLPETLHRLSFLLLLLFFGSIAREIFPLSPILFVSLVCLASPGLFRKSKNPRQRVRRALLTGVFFWALLGVHGILSDLLGRGAGLVFFQTPAGSYFLIGLFFALLPHPKRVPE